MASSQSGIIKDIEPAQVVGGTDAMPQRDWLKVQAVLPKLPELKKLVAELEKQVKELNKKGE
jgi:UDP-3-O-[3-hydroxymyristoyl] glucosamine N-acyltransferase